MKPYLNAHLFSTGIVGIAVLLAAYNGSLSPLLLLGFLVVVYPQWRGKLYRLAEKVLTRRRRDTE